MAREKSTIKHEVKDLLLRNGFLLTGLTVLIILVGGVTLVNDPSRWWVSLLGLLGLALLVFILVNAKALVKGLVASLALLFEAAGAFRLGAYGDPTGFGASLWLLLTLVGFFLMLTVSYLLPPRRSRWTVITLAGLTSFLLTYVLGASGVTLWLAALLGFLAGGLLFFVAYTFTFERFFAASYPQVRLEEAYGEAFQASLLPHHWGARILKKGGKPRSLLLWNDEHSFIVAPLQLEQKLGMGGRSGNHLSYRGKPINDWLLETYYRLVPAWGLGGAEPLLVLLDTHNRNGRDPKVVGVALPDSRKVLPVALFPAKGYSEVGDDHLFLMEQVEEAYKSFVVGLTPRQRARLDENLPPLSEG